MLMKFKQLGIVKGILGIVAVDWYTFVCAGYGIYHKVTYKSTPEYSLKLIYEAIQSDDEASLKKFIDIDTLANRRYEKS